MPYLFLAKIQKALQGIDGLSIKVVDYWAAGTPTICEAAINGKPAFDGVVAFMTEEQMRESIQRKLV